MLLIGLIKLKTMTDDLQFLIGVGFLAFCVYAGMGLYSYLGNKNNCNDDEDE